MRIKSRVLPDLPIGFERGRHHPVDRQQNDREHDGRHEPPKQTDSQVGLRSAQQAHGGQRKGQDEQPYGDEQGRGISSLLEFERNLVSVERNELRRCSRTALGQDEDLIERPECINRPQHDRDGEHGSHHRQRQVDKSPPRARSVNLGGFEGLLRQGLQAGQKNEENERRPLPDIESDEGDEGLDRIAEDLDPATPQGFGQGGEHAGVSGVDEPEHDRDDDWRDHHRNDQDRPQEPDAGEFPRAEQRQRKAQNGLDRHRNRHKAHRDPERVQKLRVAPQPAVVVEADIRQRPAIAVKFRARLKSVPQRIDEDAEHGENARREQEIRQDQIQPRALSAFSSRAPRRGAPVIDLLGRRGARRFRHLYALMARAPRPVTYSSRPGSGNP